MTETPQARPDPTTWTRRPGYEDIMYEKSVRGHRQDHHQPPRGAQRLPPADRDRDDPRLRRRPRRRRRSAWSSSPARAPTPSAPAAISACAATAATSATTASRGSTCSICSAQIRTLPKPVVAMVAGYAIGGGHVLHVVCDLTIAADNARFGQTGPKVGSFDGGYGAALHGAHRRPEEGARDLVPVPPVRRPAGARHGPRQHRGAARRARGRDRQVVPRDARSTARWRCAASRPRSTPTATARPACRSSPATPRCSTT